MKEFLEGLEALLIKHPNVAIVTDDHDSRVVFWDILNYAGAHPTTATSVLYYEDIQRFKRELGSNDA